MTFFDWYFLGVALLIGGVFGSFLNVCIYRIPAELSVSVPRSRCPKCLTPIKWYDNLPVLAWLLLRGKCRSCKAPISPRYPAIELLTALLFAGVWLCYPVLKEGQPLDFRFFAYALLIFGLLLGSFVDLDEMWIPDRVTIGGMIVGPILSFLIPALHATDSMVTSLVTSLIGLAVGFGSLWSVSLIGKLILKKDAMGFGDVKLMGAIGAFLGWEAVLFTVFVSSLIGSVVGITLIAMGKRELQGKIPFGPYISTAAIVWILGGYTWWAAYVNFVMASGG